MVLGTFVLRCNPENLGELVVALVELVVALVDRSWSQMMMAKHIVNSRS